MGRDVASFGVRVVTWVVLLGAVALLTAAVALPRLAGATPYAVLTGSMAPDLPPGTLVVVRPVATDDVRVGDVVTYQLASGDPTVVTHRVTEVLLRLDGQVRWRTAGDANPAADPEPVRPVQLRGEVWYAVPWVGRLQVMLGSHVREALTVVVGAGLLLYATGMFAAAWRDRDRAPGGARRRLVDG